MPPLTVFSCGTGPLQPSPALLGKLAEAQSIYASSALLEACPPSDARRIPIGKNAREQARELLTHRENLRPYLAPQAASPRAKRPEQDER